MRICPKGVGLYATDVAQGASVLTVRALLFYEGRHTSMDGRARNYSAADIDAIAEATQELLDRGSRIKLFSDHRYTQGGTLGTIDSVEAADIESSPYDGMDELLGLRGIYADVTIRGTENVAAYEDGRIKEISAGIDAEGTLGVKNAIIEVSAVGMPSLTGAALFGLTIADTARAIATGRDLWQVWELFADTLRSIEMASESDLAGRSPEALRAQAVEDFADQLRVRFPAPPEGVQNVPLFGRNFMELTQEQIEALQAENAELKEKLEALLAKEQAVNAYSKLKDKAITLRDAGKLSPAEFKEMGFEDQPAMLALFGRDSKAELTLQIQLDTIEKFRSAVVFGSALSGQPLPGDGPSTEDEIRDRVQSLVGGLKL